LLFNIYSKLTSSCLSAQAKAAPAKQRSGAKVSKQSPKQNPLVVQIEPGVAKEGRQGSERES
jgi:hypothetical protein